MVTTTKMLSFTCSTTHEMAERVAQTLAYSETCGPGWLRAALLYVDLVPESRSTLIGAELRVVLRADDADATRMLGVDRWVVVQTAAMSAQHLSRLKVPAWVVTESGLEEGPARSNLACAKHLAELLLLLLQELLAEREKLGKAPELFSLKLCFNCHVVNTAAQDPVPPPLTEAQCICLLELADQWRDHLLATWRAASFAVELSRVLQLHEKPPCNDEAPLSPLDPKEFPALGLSPCRTPPRSPAGYSEALLRRSDVPRIRPDVVEAVRRVAWIGHPRCSDRIWLRGGPLPHKIIW